jgi:hypothetical protein
MASSNSELGGGHKIRIAVKVSLEFQPAVVTAGIAVRVFAAYIRPRLIHRAAALITIEQLANRSVNRVLLVTKDLLVNGILKSVVVGKSLARSGGGNTEMLGQASYIVIGHCNSRVGAAVAGTFVAVESLNGCSRVCAEGSSGREN